MAATSPSLTVSWATAGSEKDKAHAAAPAISVRRRKWAGKDLRAHDGTFRNQWTRSEPRKGYAKSYTL